MCAQADGVVLGVNGDPAASPALRFAVSEAQRRSLPLTLVRSWQVSPLYEAALLMTRGELERAAVQTLQAATDAVAKLAPELRTVSRLAQGRTDELLIEASRRATLLVLGRRGGRSPWLGPVLGHVSAGAHCPVIVVPDEAPVPSHQAPGNAVVVGVDGSEVSSSAVAFALEQASQWGSTLIAVLAVEPTLGGYLPDKQVRAAIRDCGQRLLSEALAGYRENYPDVVVHEKVSLDAPHVALRHFALDAALLVLGTHGRSALTRVFLGSVSSSLLRDAPCPVAVIPMTQQ